MKVFLLCGVRENFGNMSSKAARNMMIFTLFCAATIASAAIWSLTIGPDLVDVKYGDHERNTLDLWRAKSDTADTIADLYTWRRLVCW